MKFSNEELRSMLRAYFEKVTELDPWSQLEPGELDHMVEACRFAQIEDVLFLTNDKPEQYRAFAIENGALTELHQEHRAEFCLTCSQQNAELPHAPF